MVLAKVYQNALLQSRVSSSDTLFIVPRLNKSITVSSLFEFVTLFKNIITKTETINQIKSILTFFSLTCVA
jgi:hypothetical protein